ncbi:RNA polymerase sigma factor [Pontibacter indicus]|uniref:RNA polymerase sigma-70 factor, ECF subfamily n=1 Tax=Pontibacter indicus TaxID=1317125 RepID=A0A1R3WZP7_9BACT|nr:RNA polymerase sigma factor [Pontibacter indicus]SIT84028.1 RNA polymerase sigma-70 factor, ECF subfamily [Pontibacter indicus]
MEILTDNALMLQVKSGDLDKLSLLFKRYGRSLYGFYFRFTKNAELSEDLVQDVFERVLRYRHTFRGDGKFVTWLYHLARNVLADHIKKTKRAGIRTDIDEKQEVLADLTVPGEAKQKEEYLLLMESALDRLSHDKKELLLLSKLQGMKYKDIAELHNCTEANVKVRVFRAINDLREVFLKLQAKGINV